MTMAEATPAGLALAEIVTDLSTAASDRLPAVRSALEACVRNAVEHPHERRFHRIRVSNARYNTVYTSHPTKMALTSSGAPAQQPNAIGTYLRRQQQCALGPRACQVRPDNWGHNRRGRVHVGGWLRAEGAAVTAVPPTCRKMAETVMGTVDGSRAKTRPSPAIQGFWVVARAPPVRPAQVITLDRHPPTAVLRGPANHPPNPRLALTTPLGSR